MPDDSYQKDNNAVVSSSKPRTYYSTVPGWKPSNPKDSNYVVININNRGTTTGQTSMGNQPSIAGIDTNRNIQSSGGGTQNIGSLLADSVRVTTTTTNNNSSQSSTTKGFTDTMGNSYSPFDVGGNSISSNKPTLQQVMQPPSSALTPYINGTKKPDSIYQTYNATFPTGNASIPTYPSGTSTNMNPTFNPYFSEPNSIGPYKPVTSISNTLSFKQAFLESGSNIYSNIFTNNREYKSVTEPLNRIDAGFYVNPIGLITTRTLPPTTNAGRFTGAIIETGAIAGASYFGGPVVGAEALTAFGAKDIIFGGLNSKPAFKIPLTNRYLPEGAPQVILGLTSVGLASGEFVGKGFDIQMQSLRNERGISNELIKSEQLPSMNFELQKGEGTTFSVLKGTRQSDSFAETLTIRGSIINKDNGNFFSPESLAQRTVTLKFFNEGNPHIGFKIPASEQAFTYTENLRLGSIGEIKQINEKTFAFTNIGSSEKLSSSNALINLDKFRSSDFSIITKDYEKELANQFKTNLKIYPYSKAEGKGFVNTFKKGNSFGVIKQLNENMFLTRSGKITDVNEVMITESDFFGNVKQYSDIRVDANIKDYTLTKVVPKESFTRNFDIVNSPSQSSELALKQFKSIDLININTAKESFDVGAIKSSLNIKPTQSYKPFISSNAFSIKPSTTNVFSQQRQKPTSSFAISSFDIQTPKVSSSNKYSTSSLGLTGQSFRTSQSFGGSSLQVPTIKPTVDQKTDLSFRTDFSSSNKNIFNNTPKFNPSPSFPPGNNFNFKIGLPSIIPSLGGFGEGGSRRRKKKKKRISVAPSFTAEAFNITGRFPRSNSLGINPGSLRVLPKGFKGF